MECKGGTWLSNREYLREFNKKSARLRIPLSGTLDLTHRCNLRCIHCYLGEPNNRMPSKEMDTGQILSILDQITKAGCLYFLISGGEPLLRKDFPTIYKHAKKNGLLVTIFTNGTLITDRILELFEDLPPYVVEISLYGATAVTYERITRVSGSYEKCLHGIRRLLYHKINVRLKTILMTINRHEFFDIENMAKEYGVKFRFDAAIFPLLNGDKAPLSLRVSPEDAIEKEFSDEDRLQQWKMYCKTIQEQSLSDNLYHCGAGTTSFYIDPHGDLHPCLMTTNITYNIADGNFLTGWLDGISGIRYKKQEGIRIIAPNVKKYICAVFALHFLSWKMAQSISVLNISVQWAIIVFKKFIIIYNKMRYIVRSNNKKEKDEQNYEKPRLRIIELAAEEVLAVGCKTAPGAPGQSSPVGCGTPGCALSSGS